MTTSSTTYYIKDWLDDYKYNPKGTMVVLKNKTYLAPEEIQDIINSDYDHLILVLLKNDDIALSGSDIVDLLIFNRVVIVQAVYDRLVRQPRLLFEIGRSGEDVQYRFYKQEVRYIFRKLTGIDTSKMM